MTGLENRQVVGIILGLVLGLIARSQIKLNPQGFRPRQTPGSSLLVTTIILFSVCGILAATLLPVFTQSRERARTSSCANNLKQIGTAVIAYVQDFDEKLPPRENWNDLIYPYIKSREVFICPDLPETSLGYAYNDRLSRQPLSALDFPANIVEVFDSKNGSQPSGGADLADPRHKDKLNVLFSDGHVKLLDPSFLVQPSVWGPPPPSPEAVAPLGSTTPYAPLGSTGAVEPGVSTSAGSEAVTPPTDTAPSNLTSVTPSPSGLPPAPPSATDTQTGTTPPG